MDEVNTQNIEQPNLDPAVFDQIENENRENVWKEETGLDEETLCGAVETIVFMSDKPVAIKKIKKLIHEEIPLKLLYDAISKLQKDYETKRHGIRLVEVAEGFQFRTKPIYSKFVQDLFKIQGLQLTQSALEVLAIIAYRQPVTKFDVEKVRGVDSSHLIRTLIDKRLVKISGRSDDIGRPTIYSTTHEFLDVFNLADLSGLPPEYELDEIVESQKITMKDLGNIRDGDQTKFIFDEVDEIDKLASQIRQIQTSTGFTQELTQRPKGEEQTIKNPFELLESYIEKTQIEKTMKDASLSQVLNPGGIPFVIRDLLAEVYNAPEVEEEFEMIDLETGLPIPDGDELDGEVSDLEEMSSSSELELPVLSSSEELEKDISDEKSLEAEPQTNEGIELGEDNLVSSDVHEIDSEEFLEEQAIEQALDDAFSSFKDQQKGRSLEAKSSPGSEADEELDEEDLMRSLDSNNFDDLFPKV